MSVTTNILQRTFHIRCRCAFGTCFTLDVDDKRYLATAKHVVNDIQEDDLIEVAHGDGEWLPVGVKLVGHGEGEADVSVLAPQVLFGAAYPLSITTAHLMLAEDIYFLGFPFGMSFDVGDLNAGFPMPLVKKGIVSALPLEDGLILLDGHNNPGFSGGPVVRRGTSTEQTVVGLVSAYRYDRNKVLDTAGEEGPYTYDVNTGIVYVQDARHFLRLVSNNPIGIEVSQP